MRVILKRGGNYHSRRFEPSDSPQEVPDQFGAAMIGRGLAEPVDTPPAKPRRTKPAATGTDDTTDGTANRPADDDMSGENV